MKMVEVNEILYKIRYESIAPDSLYKIAKEAYSKMNYRTKAEFLFDIQPKECREK